MNKKLEILAYALAAGLAINPSFQIPVLAGQDVPKPKTSTLEPSRGSSEITQLEQEYFRALKKKEEVDKLIRDAQYEGKGKSEDLLPSRYYPKPLLDKYKQLSNEVTALHQRIIVTILNREVSPKNLMWDDYNIIFGYNGLLIQIRSIQVIGLGATMCADKPFPPRHTVDRSQDCISGLGEKYRELTKDIRREEKAYPFLLKELHQFQFTYNYREAFFTGNPAETTRNVIKFAELPIRKVLELQGDRADFRYTGPLVIEK